MVATEGFVKYQHYDERVARVLQDLGRLQTYYHAFEQGVTYAQLRVLVLWHLGREQRHRFSAVSLKDEGVLWYNGETWKLVSKLDLRSHVIVHQPCRPDLPEELVELLVEQPTPGRDVHRRLNALLECSDFLASPCVPGTTTERPIPTLPDTYKAKLRDARKPKAP